ncbi:MAG: disulfide bond formation protein [Patescibacteria group bacterium]|nr:disulfide bond formation protein [Patescibacteria group bacterium]
MSALSVFNTITGIGSIIIILGVLLVIALVFLGETDSKIFKWIKKNAAVFTFVLALGGMIGSLIYSNVFGFAPCEFCWSIRIMLYPQVVIFGAHLWRRDANAWLVSTILSIVGLGLSIYLVLLQAGKIGNDAACIAAGVSCAKIDVIIFGWLTIPIMVLVFFVGMLTLSYVAHKK